MNAYFGLKFGLIFYIAYFGNFLEMLFFKINNTIIKIHTYMCVPSLVSLLSNLKNIFPYSECYLSLYDKYVKTAPLRIRMLDSN